MTTITRKEYNTEGTQNLWGLPYNEVTEVWDGSVTSDGLSIDDAFWIDEIDINDTAGSTGLVSLVAMVTEIQRQKRIVSASATDISISGIALDAEGNVEDTGKTDSLTEVESLKGQTIGGVKILGAYKTDGSTNYSNCNIDFKTNQDNGNAVFTIVPQEYLSQLTALLPSGSSFATTSCSVYAESGYFNEVEDTTKTNVYCLAAFNSKNYSLGCYLVSISCGIDGGGPSWAVTAHVTYGIAYGNLMKAYCIDKTIKSIFDGSTIQPYIIGSGSQYADLGIDGNQIYGMDVIMRNNDVTTQGGWNSVVASVLDKFTIGWAASNTFYYRLGASGAETSTRPTFTDNKLSLISKDGIVTSNGTQVGTYSGPLCNTSGNIFLFNNNAKSRCGSAKIGRVIFYNEDGSVKAFFAPIKNGSEYTFIDLMTMTYPTVTGSFTYSLE